MVIAHRIASFFRRNAAIVPLFIVAASILGILFLLAITNAKLSEQVRQQNNILEETKAIAEQIKGDTSSRDKAIDDLNKHMDCIVEFFSQPNNSSKSIADIQTCRIASDASTGTPSLPTGSSSASSQVASRSSQSSSSSSPRSGSSTPASAQPSSGSKTTGSTPTSTQQPGATTPPTRTTPPSTSVGSSIQSTLQTITSLPLIFVRQLPLIGGKL